MFEENTLHPNIYISFLVFGLVLGIQGTMILHASSLLFSHLLIFWKIFRLSPVFSKYIGQYIYFLRCWSTKNTLDMTHLYLHIPWLYADYCTCGYTKIWLNLCIPCCWFAINIKLISTFTFFYIQKTEPFFFAFRINHRLSLFILVVVI